MSYGRQRYLDDRCSYKSRFSSFCKLRTLEGKTPTSLLHASSKRLKKRQTISSQAVIRCRTSLARVRWARCIGADTKLARRLRSVTWPRAALLGGLVATVVVVYAAFFKASRYPPATTAKSVNSFTYDYYVHGKVKVSSERREESDQAIKLLE